jgi:translation initiation factor 1
MPANRTVYDTAVGRTDRCSDCRRRLEACVCSNKQRPETGGDGIVRVSRDRKGRKGKTATVITGIPGGAAALEQLAAELKRFCGSGGTVRENAIEIQGDHRDKLAARLTEKGYRVKLAGG